MPVVQKLFGSVAYHKKNGSDIKHTRITSAIEKLGYIGMCTVNTNDWLLIKSNIEWLQ